METWLNRRTGMLWTYIPAPQCKPAHIQGTWVGKSAGEHWMKNQQGAKTNRHGQIRQQLSGNQTQSQTASSPVPVLRPPLMISRFAGPGNTDP